LAVTSDSIDGDPVGQRLTAWADARVDVRAMLLTSTRAIPGGKVDALSDYDVILVVRDIQPFVTDRAWVGDFGEVLVAWWDPIPSDPGSANEQTGNVIQYVDGLKIDFGLWSVSFLESTAAQPSLPAELDAGYLVLLDKDGLTADLIPPTYSGYVLTPPDLATFQDNVGGFFVGAPYVAKCLLRDELLPAKWCLDIDMRDTYLRPMLTWWVGCQQGWSGNLGALGKGLKRRLPSELWAELEASWAGAGIEENWESLFRLIALYDKIAREVATSLAFAYQYDLAERVAGFARRMRDGEFGTSLPR
jgi:aminoglycoside 6-adenylyltransferase